MWFLSLPVREYKPHLMGMPICTNCVGTDKYPNPEMQKHGRRFFPVIQTGAWQTYQTRTGAVGNYGVVDLECKKHVLLWACPTPTKGNCWCCLRTTGGVPMPHGSAVESHCVSLFFLLHIRIGLVLTVMYWLYILLQTPTLFTGGHNVLLNSSH